MKLRSIGFTPGRLTLARETLGWNRRELATQTGLSDATISAWELGNRVPTVDNLIVLAESLNQPTDFFIKEYPIEPERPIFYRSIRSGERVARLKAKAYMMHLWEVMNELGKFAGLPPVTLPTLGEMPNNPFDITQNMISASVKILRDYWKMDDRPAPNITWLLESSGVVVTRLELSSDRLDSISSWSPIDNRPYIILNGEKPNNAFTSRADIVHELAHIMLHGRISADDAFDSEYFKIIERQAKDFSQQFLLPEQAFLKDVYTLNLDALVTLKPKWKVSAAFMLDRIHSAGILDSDKYSNYRRYFAARGWNKSEPLDLGTKPEEPIMIRDYVEFIVNNDLQSLEQMVELASINPTLLEKLLASPPGYFSHIRSRNIPFTLPKKDTA